MPERSRGRPPSFIGLAGNPLFLLEFPPSERTKTHAWLQGSGGIAKLQ
jgi:hypothetical protein